MLMSCVLGLNFSIFFWSEFCQCKSEDNSGNSASYSVENLTRDLLIEVIKIKQYNTHFLSSSYLLISYAAN